MHGSVCGKYTSGRIPEGGSGGVSGPPERIKTVRKEQKVRKQAARDGGFDSSDNSEPFLPLKVNSRLFTP